MTGYLSIGKRVKFAFGIFCVLFAFLAYHLYGVQITRHDELYAKAREKYTIETKKKMSAARFSTATAICWWEILPSATS